MLQFEPPRHYGGRESHYDAKRVVTDTANGLDEVGVITVYSHDPANLIIEHTTPPLFPNNPILSHLISNGHLDLH